MGVFVPLKNVNEYSIDLVGQKSLLLAQKSASTPFSLVITSDVFIEFIKFNNLSEEINILFSNEESSTENLLHGFNLLTPKLLAGKFPPSTSQSLRECFELACLDTQSLNVLQGKKKQQNILSLRRSTSYNDQDIISKGVMYTKDSYDDFLDALRVVYLSAFTPSSVVLRQKNGVEDFSIAIIVSRLPQLKTCFESSYIYEKKKLYVSSYVGFIDANKSIQRDTFDVGVDFLQINNQKIIKQTIVSVFNLQENKIVQKTFQSGVAQSATEQNILEIARLTKKISQEYDMNNLLVDFVMDGNNKIFCLDIWTSQNVESTPIIEKESITLMPEPKNNLQKAIISFLKEHKNSSTYGDTINILLRSLETDSSTQTIVQGLLICKEILEHS